MSDRTALSRGWPVREILAKPRSLRTYLVVLSVALVLPLIIMSIFLMLGFVRSEMQAGRDQLVRDATSVAADVDREISGLVTVLDTLATSSSLLRGDLATFHARASAALGPRQAYVLVVDTDMQQLLNTRRPYGTPLPKTSNEEVARRVLKTREMKISDAFVGTVSGQHVINLLSPVIDRGEVRYILILTVNTSRFTPILRAGKSREDYAILLLDGKNQTMASAMPSDAQGLSQRTPERLVTKQGPISTRVIANEVWLQAVSRSHLTGWTTVVRVPRTTLDGPLWRSLYLMALAILATVAAAFAVIVFVTRRVSASIGAIREATGRLATSRPTLDWTPGIVEAVEIMQGLREAGDLVEARTSHLRESEARYRAAMLLGKMGSWETDFARKVRKWSPEAVALFDLSGPAGIVGGDRDELIAAMHPDDRHLLAKYHAHILAHDDLDADYRIVLRDGSIRHVAGRGLVLSRQPDGAPHVLINVVADVTERAEVEAHLSEFANNLAHAKARFEALVQATAQIVWSATPSGMVVEDSPSWRAFTGQSPEAFTGYGWLDAVHVADRDRTRAVWQQAVKEQRHYQVDYRLQHVDGGFRWTRARGVPLTTANGGVTEWVGMNEDIHERVKRAEQLDIITRELSHRTKNLLAVIQSIARRTFAQAQQASPQVRMFLERLQGLAVSHDLLVHGNWAGVSLRVLVREHLKPFTSNSDRSVDIEGPDITVTPAAAQNLGLALHELATNAAKYGALKATGGKLRIFWTVRGGESGGMLDFSWIENGSLVPMATGNKGFGSQLLDKVVGASLGGLVDYRILETGVAWHLRVPVSSLSEPQ
ncbi:MAG: PAS domain-containing protein [Hyphomicrobiaceae bacterium]